MCAPELARIANETEMVVGVTNPTYMEHHCLNQLTSKRREHAIANLRRVLTPCNIFSSNAGQLFRLMTGSTANTYTDEYLGN
jgi:hypothetical protein